MVKTSFSDANILNIFSGESLLHGHTVIVFLYFCTSAPFMDSLSLSVFWFRLTAVHVEELLTLPGLADLKVRGVYRVGYY